MEKVLTQDETVGKAIFGSKFREQVVVLKSGVTGDPNRKGKRVRFRDGKYLTSDPFEIKKLKEATKHPSSGCIITLIKDIVGEEAEDITDWEVEVENYATGSGWYEINGDKVQGKEKAIITLKEMM